MKLFTFITTDYIPILQNYFLATLPKEETDVTVNIINKNGYFRHHSFAKDLERLRTDFICSMIRANMGGRIFILDVDIVFARPFNTDINNFLDKYDIVFMDNESYGYNFGCFALNCNEKTKNFFDDLLINEMPKINIDLKIHDMELANALLKKYPLLTHAPLPLRYFANHFGRCHYPKMPDEPIILFHATDTYSIEQKINLLNEVKAKYCNV